MGPCVRRDDEMHSRDARRPRFANYSRDPKREGARDPQERGRGEDRVRAAPAVSCAIVLQKKPHTSIQVKREHPGLPCAMVRRLISCSPWRPGFLATIARKRLWASRELDASVGVSGPHDFAVRFSAARPRTRRDDAAASTATRPDVSDDGRRPLMRDRMAHTTTDLPRSQNLFPKIGNYFRRHPTSHGLAIPPVSAPPASSLPKRPSARLRTAGAVSLRKT
jgi:hypothetical protein